MRPDVAASDRFLAETERVKRARAAEACAAHLSDLVGADRALLRRLVALQAKRALTRSEADMMVLAERRLDAFRIAATTQLAGVRGVTPARFAPRTWGV